MRDLDQIGRAINRREKIAELDAKANEASRRIDRARYKEHLAEMRNPTDHTAREYWERVRINAADARRRYQARADALRAGN